MHRRAEVVSSLRQTPELTSFTPIHYTVLILILDHGVWTALWAKADLLVFICPWSRNQALSFHDFFDDMSLVLNCARLKCESRDPYKTSVFTCCQQWTLFMLSIRHYDQSVKLIYCLKGHINVTNLNGTSSFLPCREVVFSHVLLGW